ncbi:MAG: site-specific integrase, partial [Streptococcaceae bacterium]|nr:site-specific integrase [Streptococcaceae bacterium]
QTRYRLRGQYIGVCSDTGRKVVTDITGKTKKEVTLKLEKKKQALINGTHEKTKKRTFDDVYQSWLKTREREVTSNTLQTYKGQYKRQIAPHIARHDITKMKPIAIQAMLDNGVDVIGWSSSALTQIYAVLKGVCEYALRTGAITSNPMNNVIKPRVRKRKVKNDVKFFDETQVKTILNHAKNNQVTYDDILLYTLVRVMLFSGMRIGEVLALKWSDIDFNESTIDVNKTWSTGKDRKEILNDTTKTVNGLRIISIHGDDETISTLKRLRLHQKELFMKHRNKSEFIFARLDATSPCTRSTWRGRLNNLYKRCNVPEYSSHALRHTHASLLFASGADIKYISERLGHASINITMDRYTHLLKTQKENVQGQLVEFMQNAQ